MAFIGFVSLVLDVDPIVAQINTLQPPAEEQAQPNRPGGDEPIVLVLEPPSPIVVLQQRYRNDRGNLTRFYNIESSPTRWQRLRAFDAHWLKQTNSWLQVELGSNEITKLQQLIASIEKQVVDDYRSQQEIEAVAELLPFAAAIINLCEARQRVDPIDPAKLAGLVDQLSEDVVTACSQLESGSLAQWQPAQLERAREISVQLQRHLAEWHSFYNQYDPQYTWWLANPYESVDHSLKQYAAALGNAAEGWKSAAAENGTNSEITIEPSELMASSIIENVEIDPVVLSDLDETFYLAVQQSESKIQSAIEEYRRWSQMGRRGNRRGNRESDDQDGTLSREDRQRNRIARLKKWEQALNELDYGQLNFTEQVDFHLLRHRIHSDLVRAEYQLSHPEFEIPVVTDSSGISGQPIGEDRLQMELAAEMIAYSPEELVGLAEQEYVWCQREIKKAAKEMGFGDDWQAAVEKVKTLHVAPGEQPGLIRDLAHEAIDYLQANQLVTIPELARETWRMQMMSPERQLVSPFFLGGEVILVSFPTLTMRHEDKLQSLRGNNIHFARATVHHELIPGHHLQGFMNSRYRSYRQLFKTPFWLEGWALYWEFRLYDRGFPSTPEDRVGFLVWRSHRCARIIFSLNFHLGRMRPQECIDLLVERVGFEPNNAAAEVRRSLGDGYGPLYQAAYMLGGVQFRSLYQEFVVSGKMTEQAFHDLILREQAMPVAMVRTILQGKPIDRSGPADWRFYD
jgi:uncharacterized protein (DUF885 family)